MIQNVFVDNYKYDRYGYYPWERRSTKIGLFFTISDNFKSIEKTELMKKIAKFMKKIVNVIDDPCHKSYFIMSYTSEYHLYFENEIALDLLRDFKYLFDNEKWQNVIDAMELIGLQEKGIVFIVTSYFGFIFKDITIDSFNDECNKKYLKYFMTV